MQEVKQPNKKPFIFYYMIALIVIILINSLLVPQIVQRAVKEVDYNTFMQMTYDKQIDEVQVQDNQIVFTAKDDKTLCRINRGHTFHAAADAVERTASRGILTGGHVILGLPGETHESIVAQAGVLSRLPLTTLKMHQLQLIRGTRMALEYRQHPEDFHLFDVEEYIGLVIDYIEHLRPDLVLERFVSQSPKELLIAPDWGLKNYEFNHRVQKRMKELGAYQGKKYEM
jgi:radical SAM protein (TIGR01212 family)